MMIPFSQNLLYNLVEALSNRQPYFHHLGAQTKVTMTKVCLISCARFKFIVSLDTDGPSDPPCKVQGNIGHQPTPSEGCHEGSIRDAMPADGILPNEDSDNTPRQSGNGPRAPMQEPTVEHRGSHSRASSTVPSRPSTSLDLLATEPANRIYPSLPSPPPFRLAPSTGPNRSGFEPASHMVNTVCTDTGVFFLFN